MKPRLLLLASVSAVLLAASAAAPAATAASPTSQPTVSAEAAAALLKQALDHQRSGSPGLAVSAYTEALKAPLPGRMRVAALYNRALAHQQSGDAVLAIDDFNAALLLDPELAHAYYGRANAMREIGHHLSALADYQKAARYKYPQEHLPLFGQALTYEQLNRPLSAEKLLKETLALKPDFGPAKERLAALQMAARAPQAEEPGAKLSVAVSTDSVYSAMTDRIHQIVTASLSPVEPDQIVRKASVPQPVRPPSHLLDAAEQVEVATINLPGLEKLSFAQTPAAISPAFIVSEKTKLEKSQDRVPQEAESRIAATKLTIEPVSAPVEFKTKSQAAARPAVAPKETAALEGFLVQINSQRSEEAAWAAWDKLRKKHGALLESREAIVQRADLGTEGIVYRLRIKGLATKKEANGFCGKLQSSGLPCFVATGG